MAEEHGFQSQDQNLRLCVNNCGFSGNPTTQNMCSKCYGEVSVNKPLISSSTSTSSSSFTAAQPRDVVVISTPEKAVAPPQTAANRCSTCRKKVGLTGFRCRCGTTFCGTHRYPEKHGCSFDFKAMGRQEIARANPVIKAVKLDKI